MLKQLLYLILIPSTLYNIIYTQDIDFLTFSHIGYDGAAVRVSSADSSSEYSLSCKKNDVVVIKASDKIGTFDIESLKAETIENAWLTECPKFLVVELDATEKNYDLCRNKDIRAAYEQFKKNK